MGDRAVMVPRAALMSVLGLVVACSGDRSPAGVGNPPPPPPQGLAVSNPVPVLSPSLQRAGTLALAGSGGDDLVYVSLSPGTVANGAKAKVGNLASSASLTTLVFDGGFDPVAVGARVCGSLGVVGTYAAGGPVSRGRYGRGRRRPRGLGR